ncbi:hypothetical protein [Microbulbifer sp. TYP-18]|uniref:hypothetical protein n=1 Tax=Microbulbifer sp. TYP-18 TaxID=3230024 RepID=UPI0034C6C35D
MLKEIPAAKCLLVRDPAEKIVNTYPAHEIPVLAYVHRCDVQELVVDADGEPVLTDYDEQAEIERLIRRYGEEVFVKVYGQIAPGCLDRSIDSVLSMLDRDDEILSEKEEAENRQRAARRQRHLSALAAKKKSVRRERLDRRRQFAGEEAQTSADEEDTGDLTEGEPGEQPEDVQGQGEFPARDW